MKKGNCVEHNISYTCERFKFDFYVEVSFRDRVHKAIIIDVLKAAERFLVFAIEEAEHFSRFSISEDEIPLKVYLVTDVNNVENVDTTLTRDFDNGGCVHTTGQSSESLNLAFNVFENVYRNVQNYIKYNYSKLILNFYTEGEVVLQKYSSVNRDYRR